MRPSDKVKVQEAVATFDRSYNSNFTEADRPVLRLKTRLARELRLARNAKERREASARYKAGLRKENERQFPGNKSEDEGSTRRVKYAGDEAEDVGGDFHQRKGPGPKPRMDGDDEEGYEDEARRREDERMRSDEHDMLDDEDDQADQAGDGDDGDDEDEEEGEEEGYEEDDEDEAVGRRRPKRS